MKLHQMTAVFQCFMEPTRLRIVRLLVSFGREGGRGICVGAFVSSMNEPQYNISKQLKILEQARVLRSRKEGRNVYFSLASGALVEGLFQLVEDLPNDRHFTADAKKMQKLLAAGESNNKKEAKVAPPRKRTARKKTEVKPVVAPPRELEGDMDLPSNLL